MDSYQLLEIYLKKQKKSVIRYWTKFDQKVVQKTVELTR